MKNSTNPQYRWNNNKEKLFIALFGFWLGIRHGTVWKKWRVSCLRKFNGFYLRSTSFATVRKLRIVMWRVLNSIFSGNMSGRNNKHKLWKLERLLFAALNFSSNTFNLRSQEENGRNIVQGKFCEIFDILP